MVVHLQLLKIFMSIDEGAKRSRERRRNEVGGAKQPPIAVTSSRVTRSILNLLVVACAIHSVLSTQYSVSVGCAARLIKRTGNMRSSKHHLRIKMRKRQKYV